jgi:hypothetical protein
MNPPATTFTFFHIYGCDGTLVVWLNAAPGVKPANKPTVRTTHRNGLWILFRCIAESYFVVGQSQGMARTGTFCNFRREITFCDLLHDIDFGGSEAVAAVHRGQVEFLVGPKIRHKLFTLCKGRVKFHLAAGCIKPGWHGGFECAPKIYPRQ